MKCKAKPCWHCRRPFPPDRRKANKQKVCGRAACLAALRRERGRRWRRRHADYSSARRQKTRDWAREYPGYWRRYRREHPEYVKRERVRRRRAQRRARRSAKQTLMLGVLVDKVASLETTPVPVCSAKQTLILRRVLALEACMRSTVAVVCSAKHSGIGKGVEVPVDWLYDDARDKPGVVGPALRPPACGGP